MCLEILVILYLMTIEITNHFFTDHCFFRLCNCKYLISVSLKRYISVSAVIYLFFLCALELQNVTHTHKYTWL